MISALINNQPSYHHMSPCMSMPMPMSMSSVDSSCIPKTSYLPHKATISNPCMTTSISPSFRVKAVKQERSIGRRVVIGGAASMLLLTIMSMHDNKAWAVGPEGPLMEEFWENVRRYALYALTVSTGVLYSVLQPIYELLRNPISAILVIIIIAGTFFIGSQILSAMVGLSDFDYQYAY